MTAGSLATTGQRGTPPCPPAVLGPAPSAAELLAWATGELLRAGVDSAASDARRLVEHALGAPATAGLRFRTAPLPPAPVARLVGLVTRRAHRVPLQYLTGTAAFRRLELCVGPGVFVPRPETELLAGAAIEELGARPGHPVCVDLYAGSGAIALAVAQEVPGAEVHAVECDPGALLWLERNAAHRAGAGDRRVHVHPCAVAGALPGYSAQVDACVANPPYLTEAELAACPPEVRDHEPRRALVAPGFPGAALAEAVAVARRLLRPGGWFGCEHGPGQAGEVARLLAQAGGGRAFTGVRAHADLTGRPRYTTARRLPAGREAQP